jgi:uncharacterized membrane protein
MITILSIVLLVLLLLVGRSRGFKTFITFYLSIFLIMMYLVLMKAGLNPIILAIVICMLAALSILFIINGINIKTKTSAVSIMIVLIFIFTLIFIIVKRGNIQGFSVESIETIGGYSYDIGVDMIDVMIGMYLICIIGTVIDTSISISSAMHEVLENNPHLDSKELFKSGMNVGRDIMATTINTLYFAIVSNFIGFFLWHRGSSFEFVINYKAFAQEVVQLLISFIGSIMIIPLTAYLSSKTLKSKKILYFIKNKN